MPSFGFQLEDKHHQEQGKGVQEYGELQEHNLFLHGRF